MLRPAQHDVLNDSLELLNSFNEIIDFEGQTRLFSRTIFWQVAGAQDARLLHRWGKLNDRASFFVAKKVA